MIAELLDEKNQNVFSDIFEDSSIEVLSAYTSSDVIAELDTELFFQSLKSVFHGKIGKFKAERIQSLEKNTFDSFLFVDSVSFAIR